MGDKLVVEIDSKDAEVAMRNLDRLTAAAEQMGRAFENTKGATSALRELRLMLTGIKGQGSSLDELKNSIQSLNSTAASLKRSFAGSVGQLGRVFKNEMAELKSIVQETGLGVGRAAAKGIEDGMAEAPAAIRKQGRTIAAAAKAEATRIYEAIVAGQANAKIKDVGALFKLDEAGATLSPYHRQVLENWKKSSAETYKALKAQLADESQKIAAAVKTEEAQLQAALKAMEQNSSTRESSLAGIYASSLARGRQDMVRVKASLKTQAVEIKVAVQTEEAQLQAALKAMEQAGSIRESSLTSIYASSLARGKQDIARVKANLKGQAAEIKATVKTEEAALQAALGAMEQASTIRQSSLASIYAGSLSRGKQDMARVKAQLKLQADEIIAAAKTEAGRIQAQVAAATNNASGAFQRYSPNTGMAGAVVDPLAKGPKKQDVTGLAEAFDKLTISGNNAHSMARGLASGFGLLWLTWGNLAPLFVGAAISNGFVQTAKTGMAVAHTLETIAVLGGNTKEEMAALSNELTRLGNSGPQGPLAIADAMKVLSLAGLKANEIIAVTQDVLNFSISGTTDLKTAADTLISVSTAFGMGAAGFGRVGDVIAKAAAESKTSVDSFANAMKTASVINAQYGVSLEDTATGIAALSQLGIEGTAAGTALRNMYADLSGRSMQVAKVLKAQGIEMRTATGEFRPMLEVVADLNTKLQTMTGIGQKNLLQALLSERGAKGIVEMLRLINTEAKDMGSGMKNALQEMRAAIEESYGFSAMSAARMAQTAEQQFAAVKATLQTSMNTAYKEMEPTLLLIADAMRKAFASPEFIEGLKTMVGLLANLGLGFLNMTTFVVDNWKAIALASAAYMGLRSIIVSKTAAMTAATAATVADTAATVANNAAKTGAAGALATMGRLIPGIGTAVSIAATAWMAYDMWQNSAKNTAKEADDLYNNNVVKSLNDQANRLEALNELRRTGLSLTEAQAVLDARGQTKQATAPSASNYAQAAAKEAAAWKEVERLRKSGVANFQNPNGFGYVTLEYFEARAKEASNTAKAAFQLETQARIDANAARQRVVDASREQQSITDAEMAKRQEKWKTFGAQGFELAGPGKNKNNSVEQIRIANANELREIEKRNAAELSMMQNQAANAQKILDARHQAGLISEGEYQAQAFAQVKQSEADQLALLNASKAEYMDGLVARATVLGDALQKAMKLGDNTQIEKFTTELQNLGQTAETFYTGVDNSIAKIADNGMARLQVASIKAQAAIKKLADTEREYWKKDKDEINKLRLLDAMEAKYKNINESVFSLDAANKAAAMTGAAETEKFNAKLAEMDYAYEVAEQAALAFMTTNIMALASGDTEAQKLYEGLRSVADALKAAREAAGVKAEASIRDRSLIAFEKARQAQINAFSSGIADAMTTAIFEGGKAGSKRFKDFLIAELKKPVVMVVNAVVNTLLGQVSGALGLGGAGGGGAGGNLLGTALQGTSLYSGLTSGTGVLGSIGNAIGLGVGASTTMGGLGATAIGSYATPSVAAMTIAPGAVAPGAGGMSGALSAIPGWGWALAGVAALAMLAKKFDDSGTPHIGAGAIYSEAGGLQEGASIYNGQNFGMGIAEEYAKGTQEGVSTIAKSLTQTFDGIANAFGKTAGYEIATAFADDSSKDGAWGSFRISQGGKDLLNWENDRQSKWAPREFANGEEGYKQYMAEIAKGARTALVTAIGDVSWAKDMLTAIGESASMEQLSATVQQIAAIKTQFVQLGKAMEMFDGISSGMESALLSAAGSIDALTASAAGYYDAVYTEQEKIARARTQLETTLAGYGQSLPATREQYRALVEQQMAAGESGAEFAVVLMGLAGTFAQVADDIDAQFAEIGKSASEVFEKLLADIGRVRGDVAGTRAEMLASAQVMTPAQIAAAVNAAMVYAPRTAGIVGAQGAVANAGAQVASRQAALDAALSVASAQYGSLQSATASRDQYVGERDRITGVIADARYQYSRFQDGGDMRNYSHNTRVRNMQYFERVMQGAQAQLDAMPSSVAAYAEAVASAQSAYDAAQGSANDYSKQLAAAQAALAAAQQAEVQARKDYAAQVSEFVVAAGTSVNKLSGLREEVVRYYEEQAQAVQSMIATAENLRNVVGSIRMGQLDSAQTASQLGNSYASDYSMALATTGSTRAGYADSMASTLPTLAEAIKAEASTASDWRVQTGKLLAQATGVAGMLEADAAGSDYQTTSLGLLDSIDTALAQIEGSTKSAEQVIAQAINDGTASQLTGMRAIVAALRGESVPAFATGGSFGGGLRLVGENGPELEVTGPSRIFSAGQTAAMLSGGGNANAELVAELRALRADNQAQAAAMVNMQRELNKLMLRWDSQGMPEERIV